MATFVLVHGAFHGAWCFVKLVPELEARGHRALAFDLPAQGDDETPVELCSLGGNAGRIAEVVTALSEPVILVGHSLGGISIAAAAELVAERIRRLVYLCAFLPKDGDSIASLSALPAAKKESGPKAFARSADGLTMSAVPEMAPGRFYSDCSAADIAYALPRFRPQPMAVQKTPVRLSAERYGRVPRAYIECLDDRAVSLGLQRAMVAASPCDPVISFATGHSPFFSAPALLAQTLGSLA